MLSANSAYVKIMTNKKDITIIPFSKTLMIGRKGCGVTDICEIDSPIVSKIHGRFYCAMGRFFYEDLGSTNGTYINDCHYGGNGTQTKFLADGDILRIGDPGKYDPVVLQFSYNEPDDSLIEFAPKVTIKTETETAANIPNGKIIIKPRAEVVSDGPDLKIRIKERSVSSKGQKKVLLSQINMDVKSGEFVLILGGSGAGKTTFMNAVMGYEKAEGSVFYGDNDMYENYEAVKYTIGFVPQQDLIRNGDSVYDTLQNAADVKLPVSVSSKKKQERIEEILEMVGLSREVDSLVHMLSGGQKKRLSIAIELISDPGLFFLDEPDSGLDGIMARSLMEDLRDIADKGKTVMIITHGSDRAIDLFDKVIVLAKGSDNVGHLAFYGSVPDAMSFFDTSSFEGIVRRINRPDEGGDGLSDHYINKYAALEQKR